MSVFNSGYIIYDARIGVIKSIFAGKKAKTCIKRQDNPLGTEKLLLTKMHFGSMI